MSVSVRPVTVEDVPVIVAMVHELAEYERAADECLLTEEQLRAAMFGEAPALFGHMAIDSDGEPVGMALWFLNFSTWRGVHGIYLEDLYVSPAARGTGAGRALLAALADICLERGYERLDWSVLDWNPARDFYAAVGAATLTDWVYCRLSGESLRALSTRRGNPLSTD